METEDRGSDPENHRSGRRAEGHARRNSTTEKMVEVFGPPAGEPAAKEKPLTAEEIERRVTAFFTYLDSREYVKAFELEEGATGNMCRRWRRCRPTRRELR